MPEELNQKPKEKTHYLKPKLNMENPLNTDVKIFEIEMSSKYHINLLGCGSSSSQHPLPRASAIIDTK